MPLRCLPVIVSLLCLAASGGAQSSRSAYNPSHPRQASGYLFQTTTRIVLTDVTVTDHKGNPVRGLTASDFSIFDNGHPQRILSFKEHVTAPVTQIAPASASVSGLYSNDFVRTLPPVLNILVIDTTNIRIVDQMYLNYELTRLLKRLPPGEPLAVYWRIGPSSILLQPFTENRALLIAAVHKALPHFRPAEREYDTDFATLEKIIADFGRYPGRKNVLWFTGGSTLFLRPDPVGFAVMPDPDSSAERNALRRVYDQLEADRIAIDPVDARGLTMETGPRTWAQRALMNNIAMATGGQAYYQDNGLDEITGHWLATSGDFYTITYSPSDFKLNHRWHKVKVQLNLRGTHDTLSYRRGYFADDNKNLNGFENSSKPRAVLLANGETIEKPDLRSRPIVFYARVVPAATASLAPLSPDMRQKPQRGTIPYDVHYLLPARAFASHMVAGQAEFSLGLAAIVFNSSGTAASRLVNEVTESVDPTDLQKAARPLIAVDQEINLHKGQNYLYLAVWDTSTGRLGTLQVVYKVRKR